MVPTQIIIDENTSKDIIVPPSLLPTGATEGTLISISPIPAVHPVNPSYTSKYAYRHKPAEKSEVLLYLVPKEKEKGQKSGNVLVHPTLAAGFHWIQPRASIQLNFLGNPAEHKEHVASYVELYLPNIYLSRPDQLLITLYLSNRVLSRSQRVKLPGFPTLIKSLRVGAIFNIFGKPIASAYVTPETKVIFRTESGRMFLFIEISKEMWHFEEDESMLLEKSEGLLNELFSRFAKPAIKGGQPTSHVVSIVLYGRVWYEDAKDGEESRAPLQKNKEGKCYRDFFRVILDLTATLPSSIAQELSCSIRSFLETVLLRHSSSLSSSRQQKLSGELAYAHDSPILEAVNLALNSFEEHWIDRDLQRTGLGLLVVTAGTCWYHVDKELLRLSVERLLFHGIGLDLISLSKRPLHTVPLFAFPSEDPYAHPSSALKNTKPCDKLVSSLFTSSKDQYLDLNDYIDPLYYDPPTQKDFGSSATSLYFSLPLFIFASFFGAQPDKPHRIDRFMPRARCYELVIGEGGSSGKMGKRLGIPLLETSDSHSIPSSSNSKEKSARQKEREKAQRKLEREKYDILTIGGNVDDLGREWEARKEREYRAPGSIFSGSGAGSWTRSPVLSGIVAPTLVSPIAPTMTKSVSTHPHSSHTSEPSQTLSILKEEPPKFSPKKSHIKLPPIVTTQTTTLPHINHTPRRSSVTSSLRTINTIDSKGKSLGGTPALISKLTAQHERGKSGTTAVSSLSNVAVEKSAVTSWFGGLFHRASPAPAPPSSEPTILPNTSTTVVPAVGASSAKPALTLLTNAVPIKSDPKINFLLDSPATPLPPPINITKPPKPYFSKTEEPKSLKFSRVPTVDQLDSPVSPEKPTLDREDKRATVKRKTTHDFNPSKMGKQSLGLQDQSRRWASIFIRHKIGDFRLDDSVKGTGVNWVSLVRGACLPITTDYLPNPNLLESKYNPYTYKISTSNLSASYLLAGEHKTPITRLASELINQRLAQGFQICTPEAGTETSILQDIKDDIPTIVHLSLSNQIHQIAYSSSHDSIPVTILTQQRNWTQSDYAYNPLIWMPGTENYTQKSVSFPFPVMITPSEWHEWDKLVAGITDFGNAPCVATREWRTRLILLPAKEIPDKKWVIEGSKAIFGVENESGFEDVDDDDIRYQGFLMLMSVIEGLRWVAPGSEREPTSVTPTTQSASDWAASVAARMIEKANQPEVPSSRSRWLGLVPTPKQPTIDLPPVTANPDTFNVSLPLTESKEEPPKPKPKPKPTVHMTHTVTLDLDPQNRSPRPEKVHCHFDKYHNPRLAYHIELSWIAASGRVIDNTVQSWSRLASRWGLSLVEVGTRPVDSLHNPFQGALSVPLICRPPKVDEQSGAYEFVYEAALLESLDFLLDVAADKTFSPDIDVKYSYLRAPTATSQYIHRSGLLLVSIVGGNEGFTYVPNRIFCAHSGKKPDEVIAMLKSACGDRDQLTSLWKRIAQEKFGIIESERRVSSG